MSAYANSLQKPEIFDPYVKKFRVICVMHNIQPRITRGPRPRFCKKFDQRQAPQPWISGDLSANSSDREGGELTDDQLLAVVIEGITQEATCRPKIATLKRTVDDLRAMLAGVDIEGPGELEPEPFSRAEAHWQQPGEAWRAANTSKTSHTNPNTTRVSSHPPLAASISWTIQRSPIPHTSLRYWIEALHRLELTHLELKQHLEAIDKRMSDLGTHPDRSCCDRHRTQSANRHIICKGIRRATRRTDPQAR